jgi:hypothetical protein
MTPDLALAEDVSAEQPVGVPPENERPELLKPEVMAALLGISRDTLDRWAALPGFPVIKQPHLVLFPWKRVLEYVDHMAHSHARPPSRADIQRKRNRRTAS